MDIQRAQAEGRGKQAGSSSFSWLLGGSTVAFPFLCLSLQRTEGKGRGAAIPWCVNEGWEAPWAGSPQAEGPISFPCTFSSWLVAGLWSECCWVRFWGLSVGSKTRPGWVDPHTSPLGSPPRYPEWGCSW